MICLLAAKTSSSHLTKLYRYQSFWTHPCFVNGFIFPAWVNQTSLLPLLPQEGSHMSLPCPQLFRRSENLQEYIIIHITQKLETRKELLIPCEIWFPYAWDQHSWQVVVLWSLVLVQQGPGVVAIIKRWLPLMVTTTERFHRVKRASPDGAGGKGVHWRSKAVEHNIPHCCRLLKKTPLPEWRLDMWYPWQWAPYIQDTPAA